MRARQTANCLRSAEQGLYFSLLPDRSEELADEAFLAMAKLRDRLVLSGRTEAAEQVDLASYRLKQACKLFVKERANV